jgi:hypothetical protein
MKSKGSGLIDSPHSHTGIASGTPTYAISLSFASATPPEVGRSLDEFHSRTPPESASFLDSLKAMIGPDPFSLNQTPPGGNDLRRKRAPRDRIGVTK